ncbi:unnamed protein product [Rotaria sordida]|uniref:Protein DIS3 homolog n=2 Tax=Rotaria sordida TaxID=392033 RepID=A0A813P8I3_9BILA|nr:unnamed protein product [Rotaria sordida]CAF0789201.1 unnamed protein product [Rotaria sordida]CAF0798141.1 unnamed protein product [Rotaria sordida]CAF3687980.1 unnamed protein product [Rotaria sordida]
MIDDTRRLNSFLRKTRRGHVLKITHELYLRTDITCGSNACQQCIIGQTTLLDKHMKNGNNLISTGHYLLVDTNIVLQQVDVLEDPLLTNVIVPQIVLDEVRHKSLAIYKRIRSIIAIPERKFFVFINEFNKNTFVLRKPGESPNDRNDRAIRKIAQFYNEHLKQQISIVLLTDDIANRDLARQEGLIAFSLKEYISTFNRPELLDRLVLKEESFDLEKDLGKRKEIIFPEHVSVSEVQRGIKSGKYLQGTFQASRENYLEANVFVQDSEKYNQLFVQGYRNLNRAVHDDIVAVEVLPEQEWAIPFSLVIDDKDDDQGDLVIEQEETGLVVQGVSSKRTSSCRIVAIIKRNWRQYCGILQESLPGARFHLFLPHERRIPKIRIESRQAEELKNSRVMVQIDHWPRSSRYPHGHFIKTLGKLGDKETENEVILAEHDILHHEFPEAVLDCLPKLPWTITEEDLANRVDLRDFCIVSIDPPGCTDIDDALHCRSLENGNFECGVHIADVTHFVRPNTALDLEARERGTTVYLTDRRIDMLPVLLSGNLCSLRGGEERFAFSVRWEITPDAKIVNTIFHKSIIKSRSAMTYEQAQAIKDDSGINDEIARSLRRLHSIAAQLRQKRLDKGALVLESSEVRFQLDTETHDPLNVINKELRETNWLVEEFMLLANISVAEKIYELFPDCACLRKHPAPPISNFDPLVKAAETKGFQVKANTGKELADSLDQAILSAHPYFNTMLRMLATRCMMQAVYFCSGFESDIKSFEHYGLATPIYTHFTSPIRRYADVLVHRLLAAGINADATFPDLLNKRVLQQICNNLNYRHRMAQYAARASVDLHTQLFFKNMNTNEDGYVFAVRKNALQILLPRYGLETTLFLRDKDGKSVGEFHEEESTQTINNLTIHMFDPVTVQISVDSNNIQRQRIQIHLVKPFIDGFSVAPIVKNKTTIDEIDNTITTPVKRLKVKSSK